MFQRPERASFISTFLLFRELSIWKKFQRPERASFISTDPSKSDEDFGVVSTPWTGFFHFYCSYEEINWTG